MTKKSTPEDLKRSFPGSTQAECNRFAKEFGKDALGNLEAYLRWREDALDAMDACATKESPVTDDEQLWNMVSQISNSMAKKAHSETSHQKSSKQKSHHCFRKEKECSTKKTHLRTGNPDCGRRHPKKSHVASELQDLPKVLFVHETGDHEYLRCVDGHRVLQHLPARIELQGASSERYATAFALYLEKQLDRLNEEKFSLFIDVRCGRQWANPPPIDMVGFIQHVTKKIHPLFPGRLHRCVIYPVPHACVAVWNIVAKFLDPQLRKLVVLIGGAADIGSPVPTDKLEPYLSKEGVEIIEAARLGAFGRRDC